MATTINVILADSTTAITVSTGARGPAGAAGNSVTSATTSDGTAALYIDSLRFETTNGGPTQLGEMAWESTDGSIDAMLESGVIVAMGEDLVIRVRNSTMTPIAKGAPLAYDGTVGASGRIDIKPWVGSNIASAKFFLGFAAAAIDANGDGYSQWFGKLSGIDTDGGAENWQDEQIIYAVPSASSTLTNVAPTSGEYAVVAVVINAGSGTSGILYVRPSFEKFPVSADITDATSDGLANPGKVLKTNSLDGSLNVGSLSCSGLGIISETASAALSIANLTDDYTYDFPDVGGTIMVGANNLSEISSASTARTNLGLGTTDSPTFGAVSATGTMSGSLSDSILNLAQTWNTTGTPTAIKLNVTDTASNANSLLMDLQVGGESRFSVIKNDDVVIGRGGTAVIINGNNNSSKNISNGSSRLRLRGSAAVSVTPALEFGTNFDVSLTRDASGILAQRNSTNPQEFRLYNTYTNASNYERGFLKWNSNVLEIGTEAAGTGAARNLTLAPAGGTTSVTGNLTASGTVSAGTYTYAQLTALTPAAGARAFCSDSDTAASGNFASTFAGTGANFVPCYYDGSNWRIG